MQLQCSRKGIEELMNCSCRDQTRHYIRVEVCCVLCTFNLLTQARPAVGA